MVFHRFDDVITTTSPILYNETHLTLNTQPSSNNSVYDVTIRLIIVLLITAWCLMLMYPFASIMLWSLILAIALQPVHSRVTRLLGNSPKLASVLIILLLLLIIIFPVWLLIGSLVEEVKILKASYDGGMLQIPPPAEQIKSWPVVGEKIFAFWSSATGDIEQIIIKYKDELLTIGSQIGKSIVNAVGGIIQIMISLVIAGVLLVVDGVGESIKKFFRKVGGQKGDALAALTHKVIGNVVKGILGESLIMAILHGIVFLLAGIPYAGIWTLLVFVLAVLQMPVFIVTVPIMVYCFALKEMVPAIMWSVSLVVVSLTDNFLTPLMLGKGAPVPMIIIFIGVIGGLLLSGFIGLFTGAVVMALGYTLFVEWVNTGQPESDK